MAFCWHGGRRGSRLTGHLQAVLQDGQQVGVGVRVAQLLLDQLKHGAGTLGVYVGLRAQASCESLLNLTPHTHRSTGSDASDQDVDTKRGSSHQIKSFGQLRVVFIPHHLKEVQMPGQRRTKNLLQLHLCMTVRVTRPLITAFICAD